MEWRALALIGLTLAAGTAAGGTLRAADAPDGDAVRGQEVYERCEGCHSLDANRVGPMHRFYGRKAGSVADYDYSQALKSADVVWDEASLDRWLQGPGKFIAGTKMGFKLNDAQARAVVIAFLKRESGK
jgi:cytochrome c